MSKHIVNLPAAFPAGDASVNAGVSDFDSAPSQQAIEAKGPCVSRRRLLQLISAAGILPGAAFAADQSNAVSILNAGDSQPAKAPPPSKTPINQPHDLLIDIITSSAVPEDTVVITNTSDEDIELAGFLPSIVVFEDRFIDLGVMGGDAPLSLNAGQVISLQTSLKSVRGKDWNELGGKRVQYVWADDAMREISQEMQLVSVAGFVSCDYAILYSNTRRLTATAVTAA